MCKPPGTCGFSDSIDSAVSDCSIPSHVCCKQLTSHPNRHHILSKLARLAGPSIVFPSHAPEDISVENIEETLQSIQSDFANAEESEEDNDFDFEFEDVSPHSFHLAFNAPRRGVLEIDQSARAFEKVNQNLQVKCFRKE